MRNEKEENIFQCLGMVGAHCPGATVIVGNWPVRGARGRILRGEQVLCGPGLRAGAEGGGSMRARATGLFASEIRVMTVSAMTVNATVMNATVIDV